MHAKFTLDLKNVNTNPGNELVVMTSIFGKQELVDYIRDAVKRVLCKLMCSCGHI